MQKFSLLVALVCLLSPLALPHQCNAQNTAVQSQADAARGAAQFQIFSDAIGLNPTQAAEIKTIVRENHSRETTIFNNTNLTSDQKRSQIIAIIEAQTAKIKNLLTPAQIQKWKTYAANAREQRATAARQ